MDGLLMVARWLHKWNIVVVPMAQWKAMNKEMEIYKATISSNFIPITSTSTQKFQDDTPPRKDDKLPPCPHCGEDEFEDYLWPPPGDYSVRCKYCGALGPPCSTWRQAREAWCERKQP